ncbi:WG repeat-containing protein [Okeania sp. KiyG1]|uniref:WG repeat-containing protein n=1 Tax=Okeania sp. KiyG1 TaxID=2720165 RepID=UPI001924AF6A|nr:WG repeat-containing protein [Okeania sp. KiyG1]GGA37573.1 hypothetical protein CYANOKiyG1_55600 [Okeania sp. KiyG1]
MTKFLIPFQSDGKWGYKDRAGKVVIPPKLETASEFSLGVAKVKINNQIQYIDSNGKFLDVNQPQELKNYHDEVTDNTEELIRFKVNDMHGYKNREGKEIIPPTYVAAWQFSEGLALVKQDQKWGYINYKEKIVIDFIYDFADSFSQGIARVRLDKKYGYINNCGEEVIPICYDELGRFNGELTFFKQGKKRGYINKRGEVVETPTNQDLPKKKQVNLKCQDTKANQSTITKKQLENTNYSRSRRTRKRSSSKVKN